MASDSRKMKARHDDELFDQWRAGQITTEDALARAKYPKRLAKRIANKLRADQTGIL